LALGVGSTLDVNSLVTQLMAAEQRPITALATKEAQYQSQITAYGTLRGALSTFQSSVAPLADPAKFSAVSPSLSDTTLASVIASPSAMSGSYSMNITQLAQSQKLQSSTAFAATSTTLGTGTLTISFGTYDVGLTSFALNPNKTTKTITIGPNQGSLSGVRDAINAANVGVSANIINDGTGNRLVMTSTDSGVANALKITVAADSVGSNTDNTGLSQLAYDGTSPSTSHMTQPTGMGPKDALLTIDGIAIHKPSNTITDAIAGMTVNLIKTGTTTLTVQHDTSTIQSALQTFVQAYNSLNTTITSLSQYDLANKQAAVLTGDSTLASIKSRLRNVFNTPLSTAGGGLTTLSSIGITFQKNGTLALDTTKLNTVLGDSSKDISTLFAAVGKPSDSLIRFNRSTTDTKSGSYAINVTQLATQGSAVGTAQSFANPLEINSANNTLSLQINGIQATVKLTAGTYASASDLATQVQSDINGTSILSSSNSTIVVSATGNALTMTSNQYGSSSTIKTISGTASSAILGAINYTNSTGLDAEGKIGLAAATGSGQSLIGTGDAKGLSISVIGGLTNNRGTVNFARGYAYELNNLVGNMLSSNNLISSRLDGINTSITQIGKDRDRVNLHLASIEKNYKTQFTALDGMLSGMKQTSNFLTQQLDNLPGLTTKK
jgi:flagellar hook-associated protein 2